MICCELEWNREIIGLPVSDVDGVDVSSMASDSSSRRVCSGLTGVRVGGAGAFLAFDRRFRNINGPNPAASQNDKFSSYITL